MASVQGMVVGHCKQRAVEGEFHVLLYGLERVQAGFDVRADGKVVVSGPSKSYNGTA